MNYFIIRCTELIEREKVLSQFIAEQKIIEWYVGFLLEAINKGKCVILDNLEEVPSTIIKRLISLFIR